VIWRKSAESGQEPSLIWSRQPTRLPANSSRRASSISHPEVRKGLRAFVVPAIAPNINGSSFGLPVATVQKQAKNKGAHQLHGKYAKALGGKVKGKREEGHRKGQKGAKGKQGQKTGWCIVRIGILHLERISHVLILRGWMV